MAYDIMEQSGKATTYMVQYVADNESDISDLPTSVAPGSSCIVISSGNVYMLNNNKQWKPL